MVGFLLPEATCIDTYLHTFLSRNLWCLESVVHFSPSSVSLLALMRCHSLLATPVKDKDRAGYPGAGPRFIRGPSDWHTGQSSVSWNNMFSPLRDPRASQEPCFAPDSEEMLLKGEVAEGRDRELGCSETLP